MPRLLACALLLPGLAASVLLHGRGAQAPEAALGLNVSDPAPLASASASAPAPASNLPPPWNRNLTLTVVKNASNYTERPGKSVAIFLQVGNVRLWKDMVKCVRGVLASTSVGAVDLFISLVFQDEGRIRRSLGSLEGVRSAYLQHSENRGADIGQFLQQLYVVSHTMKPRYDFILKMHTKTDVMWRFGGIDDLCVNAQRVNKVVRTLAGVGNLGMLGPYLLVLDSRSKTELIDWNSTAELAAVHEAWELVEPGVAPPRDNQVMIVAGSMFWVRANLLFEDAKLIRAIPALLDRMNTGYVKGSCCQIPHGVERLLPTRIALRQMKVTFTKGPMILRREAWPGAPLRFATEADYLASLRAEAAGV